jgi:hypothetical protein
MWEGALVVGAVVPATAGRKTFAGAGVMVGNLPIRVGVAGGADIKSDGTTLVWALVFPRETGVYNRKET